MLLELLLAVLLGQIDTTQLAAISGVLLGAAGLIKSLTDPRTTRIAERKENLELRNENHSLYVGKREVEDREREALRRIDRLERRNEAIEADKARLELELKEALEDVRKWRLIVGDLRRGSGNSP